MHQFRGFTDLRVNQNNQSSDTTLWPSFTDIMTVILMVFMLTMVVVIIKNTDLINQIRLSKSLQAESEQQLRDNVQVMADLRIRNTHLEENLRLIRMHVVEKDEELKNAQIMIGGIRKEAERTNRQLSLQIAELLSQLEENETTMLVLTDKKTDLELALARQRKDFSSLEDQYLKLVRPARSSLGKEVVSVQYLRSTGKESFLIKDIGGTTWRALPKEQLFTELAQLKNQLGDALYIKVVIPEDSGLSYNEAWDFTKKVLSDFDYYYTDGW